MAHGGVRLAHAFHRRRVKRIFLGLDRPTFARVAHAGKALGHEAGDAGLAGDG
jgi:hypothetical protein